MRVFKTGIATAFALGLLAPASGSQAQPTDQAEVAAGFNNPRFWEIVEAGPNDSAELETVVTTYFANGMTREVTESFARYLLREDKSADPICKYCRSIFATAHMTASHETGGSELLGPLTDAADIVVEDAFDRLSSAELIQLAAMTIAGSTRESRDRAIYYLIIAAQLEIEDQDRATVANVLANIGFEAEALEIATAVYNDSSSIHFQSEQLAPWIRFLDQEVERRRIVGTKIVAAATD